MTTDKLVVVESDHPQELAQPKPATSRPMWLAPLAALAALAAATWITVVAVTAGTGFDITDEGFYLLSYRWWDTNLRTFSAVQYVYGPVFEALGYNIAWLRLFRLMTIVVTLAAFGWTFMRWLRRRRPNAPASRLWEFAGTAAIVAAGAATYGWLPLSPGYNDISLLAGFIAATTVIAAAIRVEDGRSVPPWIPAILGVTAAVAPLVKWTSSAAILGAVAVAGVVVLLPLGWRGIAKFTGWAVLGVVVTLAAVHLLVVPLDVAVPEMLAVNKLAASSSNSPARLLYMYWDTSVIVAQRVLWGHKVLFAATALALVLPLVLRGRKWEWIGLAAVGVGFARSAWLINRDGGLEGGTPALTRYPLTLIVLLAVALLIAVAALIRRRWGREPAGSLGGDRRAGWVIYVVLLALPALQALGTGNPLYMMAINAFAAWMALIIAVLTGVERSTLGVRVLAAATAAGAVAAAVTIGVSGVAFHPYRTSPYAASTVSTGVPALSSVRMDPATATAYGELYRLLEPYVEPQGRAVMAFDEMAGIVLLLGGRSVGEGWYSQLDPGRAARGIEATCADGRPWWGSRHPIIIFNREVRQMEIDALATCGLTFATDYRELAPGSAPLGLKIYVPQGGV
jgi:hypothetical protein